MTKVVRRGGKKMERKGINIEVFRVRLRTVMSSDSCIGVSYRDTFSDLYVIAFDKQ